MKRNAVIILILIISIFALISTLIPRIQVEANNKVVDVVLDYNEFRDMANQSEQTLMWWFERFKDLGVEYVGLQEESLESLLMENNQLEVFMGWEMQQAGAWREVYPTEVVDYIENGKISEYDLVVVTKSQEVFDFIHKGLESRYTSENFQVISKKDYYVIVLYGSIKEALYRNNLTFIDIDGKLFSPRHKPHSSKLMQVGLGFDPEKIKLIQESGLKILPRPYTYREWMTQKYMEAVLSDFEVYNMKPPVFIFSGGEVLGYPESLETLTTYMLDNDIKAGLIETSVQRSHLPQDGLNLLVRSLNYQAVRVFSIWPYIQERFGYFNYEGAEEIENTLYRAVTERNIRFIYFKPFKTDKLANRYDQFIYITDYDEYEKMFKRFETRLAQHGMTLGRSSTMPPLRVRIAKQTLMGWGIVAAGLLLLNYLLNLNKKVKYGLLVLGVFLIPVAFVIKPVLMEKVMALMAAIIFPSLGMVYFCDRSYQYLYKENKSYKLYQNIFYGARDLVFVSGISLLGGLFIGGILSHVEYLLEMDIFRGVKASQIIPIIIFTATYAAYFGYKRNNPSKEEKPYLSCQDVKRFLFEDIKIIYLILIGFLGVIGYIYIARTGHETNIQPSTIELIARNILEENLLARPRSKEFLIGFPALMMGIYFAKKKIKGFIFLSGLAAVIGQASIANTFSHLRTPLYLSLVRTFYSLVFGIFIGVVYILLFEVTVKFLRRIKKIYLFQQKK